MEGYADCIMAHQFGITNAVATLGTALTENHVSALKRFTRKVILVFDGDKAGKDAAEKSLPRFLSQEVDLRILTLTSEKDPADFSDRARGRTFPKAARNSRGSLGIQATLVDRAKRSRLGRRAGSGRGRDARTVPPRAGVWRFGTGKHRPQPARVPRGPIGVANSRDVRHQPPQGEPGGRVERAVESCGGRIETNENTAARMSRQPTRTRTKQNWKANCSRSCSSIRRPSTCCELRSRSTTSSTNTTGDCWRSVIDSLRRGSSLRMTM